MVTITLQARPQPLAAATAPRSERGRAGHAGIAPGVATRLVRRSDGALPHVPGGALPWALDAQRRHETIQRSFAAANAPSPAPSFPAAATRWLARAVESLCGRVQRVRGIER